jgi:hypothetical protein
MATNEHIPEDELKPEETEGFKVGEKKTIDEYHQLGTYYVILDLDALPTSLPNPELSITS